MPLKICDCREEYRRTYDLANGRRVTYIIRTSVVPEDPYLALARAKALTVRTGEAFASERVSKSIRDYLIKTNIAI